MTASMFSDRERLVLRIAYLYKKALRNGKPKKHKNETTLLTKKAAMKELLRLGNKSVLTENYVWKSARGVIKNFCTRAFVPAPIIPTVCYNIIPADLWRRLRAFESRTASSMIRAGEGQANLKDIIVSSGNEDTAGMIKNLSSSKDKSLSELVMLCIPIIRDLLVARVQESENLYWVVEEFDRSIDRLLLNVSLVLYEKEKEQGLKEHIDANATFVVAICAIRETDDGSLAVPDIVLSTPLPERTILFYQPHHSP